MVLSGREFTIFMYWEDTLMYPYIDIFGRKIGTYGLCMLLGFFLVGILALRRGKPRGLCVEDILVVAAMALGGALVVGGFLYIVVTYSFAEILTFIRQGDFRFLGSGIVFYGGLVGGILGALLGIRMAKCDLHTVEYSVVPFIPLGHAIGRIGCVMAGCCYGFEYDGPFALYYHHAVTGIPADQGYFPVQPLEALLNVGICIVLLLLGKRVKRKFGLLAWYLVFYAITRFFLEMLRGDMIRGVWNGLSTSQYISIALLILCGIRLLFLHLQRRAKEK